MCENKRVSFSNFAELSLEIQGQGKGSHLFPSYVKPVPLLFPVTCLPMCDPSHATSCLCVSVRGGGCVTFISCPQCRLHTILLVLINSADLILALPFLEILVHLLLIQ